MTAKEEITLLREIHLTHARKSAVKRKIALIGEDCAFFRSIIRTANEVGVEAEIGTDGEVVIVDLESEAAKNFKYPYSLTDEEDIDCLMHGDISCVAEATYELLAARGLCGKSVTIVGRGHAVKGLARALVASDATVTVCHSKTVGISRYMTNVDYIILTSPVLVGTPNTYINGLVVDISRCVPKELQENAPYEYVGDIGRLTTAIVIERACQEVENGFCKNRANH